MNVIRLVLFDLDGTLLDTAPDLLYALNHLRAEQHLPPLPLSAIRPIANLGSKAMIKKALNIDENHQDFMPLREKFLTFYKNNINNRTELFPQIEEVLCYLEECQIPWGIVTNKLSCHASALLKAFYLDTRAACIVYGDSLATTKPDPGHIRYACELLKQQPQHCLYVGDAITDMMASKAAGTRSLLALYGYIHTNENPFAWEADGYIQQPIDIINWLTRYLEK